MLVFLKAPFLVLLHINYFTNVIYNIDIYVDNTTLYSKCDEAFDLWQQLKLASDLGSEL